MPMLRPETQSAQYQHVKSALDQFKVCRRVFSRIPTHIRVDYLLVKDVSRGVRFVNTRDKWHFYDGVSRRDNLRAALPSHLNRAKPGGTTSGVKVALASQLHLFHGFLQLRELPSNDSGRDADNQKNVAFRFRHIAAAFGSRLLYQQAVSWLAINLKRGHFAFGGPSAAADASGQHGFGKHAQRIPLAVQISRFELVRQQKDRSRGNRLSFGNK